MKTLRPHYITDHKGKKISVIISIEEYEAMLAKIEKLEKQRLYNTSNNLNEPSVAYGQSNEVDGDTDEEILANIKESVKELKLIMAGKVKATPARDFLNEL